jgi:hypothetical protein
MKRPLYEYSEQLYLHNHPKVETTNVYQLVNRQTNNGTSIQLNATQP